MPRIKMATERQSPPNKALAEKLANALKDKSESGQPLIYEQELGPDRLRIVVAWDEWAPIPLDERTDVILGAYEIAEGKPYRKKITLASGLTVPEATAAGMLPYQIGTALRKSDPVTIQQVWDAELSEGASTLFGPRILQLRFATENEAESCRQRLIKKLPNSDDVWIVTKEIALNVRDTLALSDMAEVEKN